MAEERYSFGSNPEDQESRKRVKLNSSKSKFANEIAKKDDFDQRAEAAVDDAQNKKEIAVELAKQFWSIAKDTTLEKNKGPIQKSLEKEVIGKLLEFASSLNNDTSEFEGAGSMAIIMLLLKISLHLRDNNNSLNYKLTLLEDKVNKLTTP